MKNILLITITYFILTSCTKERITTPYKFVNMKIEEIEDTNGDFRGEIKMKGDTIHVILEEFCLVKDSLTFRNFEAYHFSSGKPEIEINVTLNRFLPSNNNEDLSDIKMGTYRTSFDLIGINPGKKFKASVYFHNYHTLTYP